MLSISRFNHCCDSNAEIVWRTRAKEEIEIRAITKINAGDEITINYNIVDISPRRFKRRQELLSNTWGFKCTCSLCEKEKLDPDDRNYDQFERTSQTAQERQSERKTYPDQTTDLKLNEEILCYGEMYKFGREKRASRQYLIRNILTPGWETAFRGYKIQDTYIRQIEENVKRNKRDLTKKELEIQVRCKCDAKKYKDECDNFAKIAEKLVKVVYGQNSPDYHAWNERLHYFDEQNNHMEQFLQQFNKL